MKLKILLIPLVILLSFPAVFADSGRMFSFWHTKSCEGLCIEGSEIEFVITIKNELDYTSLIINKIRLVSDSNITIAEKDFNSAILPPNEKSNYRIEGIIPHPDKNQNIFVTTHFNLEKQNETSGIWYYATNPLEIQLKKKPDRSLISLICSIAILFLIGQYSLYNWVTKKSLGEDFKKYMTSVGIYFDKRYDSFLQEAKSLKQRNALPEEKLLFLRKQSVKLFEVQELYSSYMKFDDWYKYAYLFFGISFLTGILSFYLEFIGTFFWGEIAIYAFVIAIIIVIWIGYNIIELKSRIRKHDVGTPLDTFLEKESYS